MRIKQQIADKHGLRFIIIEENTEGTIAKINENLYTVPSYNIATNDDKEKANLLIASFLPYDYKKELWNDAATYMRQWRADIVEYKQRNKTKKPKSDPKPKKESTKKYKVKKKKLRLAINQYDTKGNLLNSFASFNEIKKLIQSGCAFGYEWKFEDMEE